MSLIVVPMPGDFDSAAAAVEVPQWATLTQQNRRKKNCSVVEAFDDKAGGEEQPEQRQEAELLPAAAVAWPDSVHLSQAEPCWGRAAAVESAAAEMSPGALVERRKGVAAKQQAELHVLAVPGPEPARKKKELMRQILAVVVAAAGP